MIRNGQKLYSLEEAAERVGVDKRKIMIWSGSEAHRKGWRAIEALVPPDYEELYAIVPDGKDRYKKYFSEESVSKLIFVRDAVEAGFSYARIREIMKKQDFNPETECQKIRANRGADQMGIDEFLRNLPKILDKMVVANNEQVQQTFITHSDSELADIGFDPATVRNMDMHSYQSSMLLKQDEDGKRHILSADINPDHLSIEIVVM